MQKLETDAVNCEMEIRKLAASIAFERDLSKFREASLWGLFEAINILIETVDNNNLGKYCEVFTEVRNGLKIKQVK